MSEPNKPIETIRDGNLKAAIFRNEGEKGTFYSTKLARTYTDKKGNMHETNVFSGTDPLRVSELARNAYRVEQDLRKDLKKSQRQERSQAGEARQAFDARNHGESAPASAPQRSSGYRRDLQR